ncbi:MAG: hypothetical protein LW602_05425 [Sediminibacterium sp.]|nr:hypothetical protein [Sediminibacterium sp.]
MDQKILIIEIRKGGLGDHLFYSHLPRIAKQTKAFDKVYISNHSFFRHPDYKKIVWELNPFIDGFTNNKGVFKFSTKYNDNQNMLDSIMLAYGLDDGIRMHEPEVYYKPNINDSLAQINIYDPNYQSYTGDLISGRLMDEYFSQNDISIHYQMKFLGKRYLPIQSAQINSSFACNNLFEFCDLLASVNKIYCLTTGTATLAAAINKKLTVFYGNGHIRGYRHSPLHDYICLGTDYKPKHYIRKWVGYLYSILFKKD